MAGKAVKWSSSELQSMGREALSLAKEFRSVIESRLPAGLIEGLEVDLTKFDDKRAAASNALGTLKLATRQQDEAVAMAVEFLSAARQAVIRAGASATQREAFGTTRKYNVNNVSSVVAALDAFAVGAETYTDFTRAAGVLPADLEAAKSLRAALVSADQSQEAQKSKRKEPTAQRNDAQKRIEAAIDAIINAGRLAFMTKPATAARFHALIPKSSAKSSKKPAPSA
jgi:hypothetical protein